VRSKDLNQFKEYGSWRILAEISGKKLGKGKEWALS